MFHSNIPSSKIHSTAAMLDTFIQTLSTNVLYEQAWRLDSSPKHVTSCKRTAGPLKFDAVLTLAPDTMYPVVTKGHAIYND